MKLNEGDVAALRYYLYRIRSEVKSPKKNAIENLCSRAGLVLKKADRRENRPVKLKFEIGDFD